MYFVYVFGTCVCETYVCVCEWYGCRWELWKQYIFSTQVKVLDRNKPNHFNYLFVVGMMQKISRHKYPAITQAEEAMSIPLQVTPSLCSSFPLSFSLARARAHTHTHTHTHTHMHTYTDAHTHKHTHWTGQLLAVVIFDGVLLHILMHTYNDS